MKKAEILKNGNVCLVHIDNRTEKPKRNLADKLQFIVPRESREIEFDKVIKWAVKNGFDFYMGKWDCQDDGRIWSNKKLYQEYFKAKK